MDLFVLDSLLRRVEVFDVFKSLIWTERFAEIGDFELVITPTARAKEFLTIGTRLAIRDSIRVMEIETIESKDSDEGRMLTISGRSIEKILQDRVAKAALTGTAQNPAWKFTGKPANIMRDLFKKVCIDGVLSDADKIPLINNGYYFGPTNIREPIDTVQVDVSPTDLYSVMKQVGDPFNLGFRLVRIDDDSGLYFEVYTGNNRTSNQREKNPVIFSQNLENLSESTELESKALYKNVAYVFGKNGSEIVYSADANASTSGFDRRVMVVDASDVTLEVGQELSTILVQKGLEALSENRALYAFDGEVLRDSQYSYPKDYQLGDLVEVQNTDSAANWMRVTEQIFVSDSEGDRSYPTLTLDMRLVPGTWFSWDPDEVWDNADGTWDELE